MLIYSFTKPELEYLKKHCNFVNYELPVFEMRSKGIPLAEIAESLNISIDTARRTSQKVNRKIGRLI